MAVTVPGYGTFDPAIPSWLELRADGKLYNKNATDPNRVWRPPEGYVGDSTIKFTPEGATTPPPVTEPPTVPIWQPPPPGETPPPAAEPSPLAPFFKGFFDSFHALVAHYRANIDTDVALAKTRLDEEAALTKDALDKLDALNAALAAVAPK